MAKAYSELNEEAKKAVKYEWFVYELRDEYSQEVGYVGCTKNPYTRLRTHLREAGTRWKPNAKELWIREVLECDSSVILHIVAGFTTEVHAKIFERMLIRGHLVAGTSLCNSQKNVWSHH